MCNGTSVNPVGTVNLNSCLFSHNGASIDNKYCVTSIYYLWTGVSDEQEVTEEEG